MFLLKLKDAWKWIIEATSKAWAAIKKLPGWAVLVLLFLVALCWWLAKSVMTKSKINEIQTERVALEVDHKKAVEKILDKGSEEEASVEEKFEKKYEELDEREKELFDSVSEGPIEIAKEWQKFLGNKDEE